MTNSISASFENFTPTDLFAIQDALEAQARATEKFIHNHLEPVKASYPSLFESYNKRLIEETNRFNKFKAILDKF